jgi:glycosyltransferase involved in cell wall biosynthesis
MMPHYRALNQLSVLVTVFNKFTYLPRLCELLLTFSKDGAQIIVIDDGSTDGSSEFLSHKLGNYPNIINVLTSNNGSARARNFAMSLVDRDFFIFLDADDWIDIEKLKIAVNSTITMKADLSKFPYWKNGELKENMGKTFYIDSICTNDKRDLMIQGLGYWRYIYKSSTIIDHYFFFPEKGQLKGKFFILDDLFWLISLANSNISLAIFNSSGFYHYDNTDSSDSYTRFSKQFILFPFVTRHLVNLIYSSDEDLKWQFNFFMNHTKFFFNRLTFSEGLIFLYYALREITFNYRTFVFFLRSFFEFYPILLIRFIYRVFQ